MSELSEIEELLMSFFDSEQLVDRWLNTENPNLGGSKPMDLIESGRADKVLLFVKASIEGY